MSDPLPAAAPPKPSLGERLQQLVAEYGRVGIWVYGVIYLFTFGGFLAAALSTPVEPGAGRWAVWGVAYAGFKLTQPFRILGAIALTPLVARLVGKAPAKPPAVPADPKPTDAG